MSDFFPPRPGATPTIYAFAVKHPDHEGLLKVGYTESSAAERVAQQFPGGFTGYDIKLIEPAMRPDGSSFTKRDAIGQAVGERAAGERGRLDAQPPDAG